MGLKGSFVRFASDLCLAHRVTANPKANFDFIPPEHPKHIQNAWDRYQWSTTDVAHFNSLLFFLMLSPVGEAGHISIFQPLCFDVKSLTAFTCCSLSLPLLPFPLPFLLPSISSLSLLSSNKHRHNQHQSTLPLPFLLSPTFQHVQINSEAGRLSTFCWKVPPKVFYKWLLSMIF